MKRILLLTGLLPVLLLHASSTDSYRWLHAKAFNGMNSTGMTVDSQNNTYFYGFSYTDIKYGEVTTSVNEDDRASIFVIKLNAQNEYQWTKRIKLQKNAESSSLSINVRSMDVDDNGNMYFGGDFNGVVDVNSQTYGFYTNNYAYFIMKTDASGAVQWFEAGGISSGSVHEVKYTAGRVAFVSAWNSDPEVLELFGTDLMTKFGSLQHFSDCDMMVGALSAIDGDIVFAQGIKTGHDRLLQQVNSNLIVRNPNTLDVDNAGNLYLSGGFISDKLKVAGVEYDIATGIQAEESQFVLRVGTFGEISWVKIISNAKGIYPTIAVNNTSGVAVLYSGGNNFMKIGDQAINVNGDATKMNHIALFSFTGELMQTRMINANALHIAPAPNGSFCVAGNLTSFGQNFGMDGLYNGESERENLFVGFFDRDMNAIAGQSVMSEGMYMPASMKLGADGKIRLLGNINFEASSNSITYPFGENVVSRPDGDNKHIFSVLDPKQLVKAQLNVYPIDCGRYAISVNPSMKSRVQWFVNGKAKGTEFNLTNDEQMGGYLFEAGVYYVKALLTDSTDATNTAECLDTITVYNPVVNINTQINPQTGVVNYSVVVSNYAPEYNLSIDRGNYDYDSESNGTYTYAPGTHTIKVILSEMSNHNCFFRTERSFVVPEPNSSQECENGVIRGRVESSIASFLAGEVRVDVFRLQSERRYQFLNSDIIDENGGFMVEGLPIGDYVLRANIIDPTKYPALLVTYFNNIMNQVTSWQDATPIALGCNQWADLNLTFAAINEVLNGTGSISGIVSYSNGEPQGARAMIKASTQVGDVLVSNAPVVLRKKANGQVIARTTTDENGIYNFENLPDDEYEIVVDIPGLAMESTYDVTISSTESEVENRNFVITQTGINTTNQYAIVATVDGEGVISNAGTKMLNAGENLSYSITPDAGHFIDDVLVNGVSVGAVSSYDFSNVNSNQTIHVVFRLITGQQNFKGEGISVSPTAFEKDVVVKGLVSGSQIHIYNQMGVGFYNSEKLTDNEITLNLSHLTAGMYFIQIKNENGSTQTFKVLKK
jgi:hypothetical protein